jgi:hypothetical protein
MASIFTAGTGRKKLALKIHDDKAPKDNEVLRVYFEQVKRSSKPHGSWWDATT